MLYLLKTSFWFSDGVSHSKSKDCPNFEGLFKLQTIAAGGSIGKNIIR